VLDPEVAMPETHPLWDAWTGAEFWGQTVTFLSLVLGSLGIALLVGIPLGILLTRLRTIAAPVIATLALLQTFPSLALLGLLIPLLGVGQPAAIFLAVVYSLFPVVMNTHVGITQVPAAIRDAARGMGMTDGQILRQVELPLALPVILAGVRTGAVYAISIITICAFAGAGGLGDYIIRGMNRSDNALMAVGAVPLLALTLLVFWGLGGIAWVSRRRSQLGLVLGGGLIAVLSVVGVWVVGEQVYRQRARASGSEIRIGAKNFVEGEILAEILKQMLEAHTDLRVTVVKNLTPPLIFKALEEGDIDLYPEYTGVLLTNRDALDLPVPEDRSTITAVVRAGMRKRHDMELLPAFGLNNTYVLCAPRALAEKLGLKRVSDLRRHPGLRVVVDLDFLDRADGWKGLVKAYGLELPRPQLMTPDLRYKALDSGDVDVVLGFATDWEIAFYKLAVLEDDRHYFPSYHGAPLARGDVLRRYPQIAAVLTRLGGQIDDATMRELNFQVARERRAEADVAQEFLRAKKLLP
jgi:osmoprotectant transport system permease protein